MNRWAEFEVPAVDLVTHCASCEKTGDSQEMCITGLGY